LPTKSESVKNNSSTKPTAPVPSESKDKKFPKVDDNLSDNEFMPDQSSVVKPIPVKNEDRYRSPDIDSDFSESSSLDTSAKNSSY